MRWKLLLNSCSMQNINLHTSGEIDYLKILKETYHSLINNVKKSESLGDKSKRIEINTLTENFKKQKKDSKYNLY